jgi:flagellar motility protein MotE (MotC chaperone)
VRRLRLLPATMVVAAVLLVSKAAGIGLALLPAVAVVAKAAAAPAVEPAHAAPPSPPVQPASMPREPSAPPPPVVSEAERRLLQDLRARREELDSRDRILVQREGVLDAAEQRLTARVTQLSALQARLEQLEKERRDHDEANWLGLVKVYETMKPREAAAIFNDMDLPVLLGVLDRMKEAKAATVLGAMQPDRARMATTQLAAQRTHGTTVPPARPDAG